MLLLRTELTLLNSAYIIFSLPIFAYSGPVRYDKDYNSQPCYPEKDSDNCDAQSSGSFLRGDTYTSFKKEVTEQLALGKFVTTFEIWQFLGTPAAKSYFK